MSYSSSLALPVMLLVVALRPAPQMHAPMKSAVATEPTPLITRAVAAEVQREDQQPTFLLRWEPATEMPVQKQIVRTTEVRYAAAPEEGPGGVADADAVSTVTIPAPQPRSPRHRVLQTKRVGLGDVCQRHRMRKVWTRVGRWPSWRCKR